MASFLQVNEMLTTVMEKTQIFAQNLLDRINAWNKLLKFPSYSIFSISYTRLFLSYTAVFYQLYYHFDQFHSYIKNKHHDSNCKYLLEIHYGATQFWPCFHIPTPKQCPVSKFTAFKLIF